MPVRSLRDITTRVAIKHIDQIDNMGNMPYSLAREILSHVKRAKHLRQLEINSPHLCGDTEGLWRKFIKRDFPKLQEKYNWVPKNPKKWYSVYEKYRKTQEEDIKIAEDNLRQQMLGLQEKKGTNVSKLVSIRELPRLPRDRRQMANSKPIFKKDDPSALRWTTGSKTKLTDGKSVLTRARREAKEIAQMAKLSKPTHQLEIGRVTQVPKGMANQYRIAAQPGIKIRSPSEAVRIKAPSTSTSASKTLSCSALEEREARLRALTTGKPLRRDASGKTKGETVNYIGSSGSEDEDAADFADDLFDNDDLASPPPQPSKSSRPIAQPRSRIPQASTPSPPKYTSKPTPQPRPRVPQSSSPEPARPVSRDASPADKMKMGGNGKPVIMRKRAPVDIFNRGAKKVRRV